MAKPNQKELQRLSAALNLINAFADTIRDVGQIPSGHLYATVMALMSLEEYGIVIAKLKSAGVVKEQANLLIWVGPKKEVR